MKNRRIADLHGNEFKAGDYQISDCFPWEAFSHSNRTMVLTRDTISDQQFILVSYETGAYGYVFYENTVYIYGLLSYVGYNKQNDIRHVKEGKGKERTQE